MMQVKFSDFYGQLVTIHDGTASGNVRMEVITKENLNDIGHKDKPDIRTDISLDDHALNLLIQTLLYIKGRREEERNT